ncbi:S-layer homology domain-containing protein [Anaerovorax odorimutans]|uniref:S-layer homology domain-containing protein n=1 Tax=Anaerovorax odorimutans TaxID=109327 RepID=UPI000402372D|nr:S-layer homology domain-containing protein [Anaerovorax odorimutans]
MIKKLIITLALIVGISSTVYAATTAGNSYTDVKSTNWAYDAINTMSNKSIIKGYPDGSFKPSNTLTYGEFIKMAVVSSTGKDVGNAEKPYNWAQKYYESGIENKYYTEESIPKHKLDREITRSDMALIISSILGDVKIDNYDTIQAGVTDVTAKTENEYDIIKSYASGILTGYEDNTFKPDKTLTRAESAVVIQRLVDESKRVMPSEKKEETTPIDSNRDYSSLKNLSKSSTSTLPVTDIASNIYSFTIGNLAGYPPLFEHIKYYEIIKDYPYEIKRGYVKDGSQSIDVSKEGNAGLAMLIKDNQINCRLIGVEMDNSNYVSFCQSKSRTLPDFDYIAFYNSTDKECDTLILVQNTFK